MTTQLDPMKLPPLDPTDPASLDSLLSDDEKAVRRRTDIPRQGV